MHSKYFCAAKGMGAHNKIEFEEKIILAVTILQMCKMITVVLYPVHRISHPEL